MNYLNIHTDILRGVEFIGAEPVERATWIALLGWCATQENSGVIKGCKSWKNRQWQQLAGVTEEEVKTISPLYGFEGDDLVVAYYPIDSEKAVKAKREKGKLGGRPKKEKPKENPDKTKKKNQVVDHVVSDPANQDEKEKEGKGKDKGKDKGKEKKTKKPPPSADSWDSVFPKGALNKPKTNQRKIRVLRTNSQMQFIGKWFGRKDQTLWSVLEASALRQLAPSKEEVKEMDAFRKQPYEYHRTSVYALLNNWDSDLDKARLLAKPKETKKRVFTKEML